LRDIFRIFGHARMNEGMIYDEARNVIRWGQIVQKNGALALDRHIKNTDATDHFISYGIQLVVDGYKPPVVRELLTNSMQSAYDRAMRQVDVLRNMASTAPAFGMIGTLVG
ncbi:MAG TPA: flagellar motor protein MotA, partial [Deltaproteobacteria bacterium]|nr:flagellar motor protein MotA [Deltaproteobacteria bacterium]